jgi:hypothetical protein
MAITSHEPRPVKLLKNGDLQLWDGRIAPTYGRLIAACLKRGLKATDLADLAGIDMTKANTAFDIAKLSPTDHNPWEQVVNLWTKWERSPENLLCGACGKRCEGNYCNKTCRRTAKGRRHRQRKAAGAHLEALSVSPQGVEARVLSVKP